MTKYKIYEDYLYTHYYTVEANSEQEAIDKVLDDPYEYRDYESNDEHKMLVRKIEELDIDVLMREAYEGVEDISESELEEYACPSCGKLKCNGYCDK